MLLSFERKICVMRNQLTTLLIIPLFLLMILFVKVPLRCVDAFSVLNARRFSSSTNLSRIKLILRDRDRHHQRNTMRYSNTSSNNGRHNSGDDSIDYSRSNHSCGHQGKRSSSFPPTSHSLQDGRLKYRLRHGLPLTGVVTGQYRDTDHVEMLGLLGYDFLWADCEHSSASPDHVLSMILAAERRGMPTLVRIGYGYQNVIG
jgi:hypothetical protein